MTPSNKQLELAKKYLDEDDVWLSNFLDPTIPQEIHLVNYANWLVEKGYVKPTMKDWDE